MLQINFFTEDIKFNLKNKTALRKWIAAAVKKEGYKIEALNYIFCSDKFLHHLNEEYLHHDDYTDIITFNLSSYHQKPKTKNQKPETVNLSGEIFISIDRVKENAKIFNTTFLKELRRVIIHGVLHLCGYKDKTKRDKNKMRVKEDYYLSLRKF